MTESLIDGLNHALAALPWGIYVCAALAPFVQEDAAVLGVAAASSTGNGETAWLFAAVLAGLTLSDLWKYWLGRAALTQAWARNLAEKRGVQSARDRVLNRLGVSLIVVRFIPGTRIAFYLASGLFKAPFGKFSLFVALSAAVYIGLAFGLFHALGAVLGEQVKNWLPLLAVGLVAIVIATQWVRSRRRKADALNN